MAAQESFKAPGGITNTNRRFDKQNERPITDSGVNGMPIGCKTEYGELDSLQESNYSQYNTSSRAVNATPEYTVKHKSYTISVRPLRHGDGLLSGPVPDFKPIPLRKWYTGMVLVVVLALLSLTELAVQLLPDANETVAPAVETQASGTEGAHENQRRRLRVHQTHDEASLAARTVYELVQAGEASDSLSLEYRAPLTVDDDLSSSTIFCTQTATVTVFNTKSPSYGNQSCVRTTPTTYPPPVTVTTTVAASTTLYPKGLTSVHQCVQATVTVTYGDSCGGDDSTITASLPESAYINAGPNTVTITLTDNPGGNEVLSASPTDTGLDTGNDRPVSVSTTVLSIVAASPSPTASTNLPAITPSTSATGIGSGHTKAVGGEIESNGATMHSASELQGTTTVVGNANSVAVQFSEQSDESPTVNTQPDTAMPPNAGPEMTGFLTTIAETLRNAQGRPTATESNLMFASGSLTTATDASGRPVMTGVAASIYSEEITVLKDTNGKPLTTMTYFAVVSMSTLTDSRGLPTSTMSTFVAEVPSLSILSDESGRVTGTSTLLVANASIALSPTKSHPAPGSSTSSAGQGSGAPRVILEMYEVTNGQYFVGLILPTLLGTLLGIPLRIIDGNAKLYRPFHNLLSTPNGASASESVLLPTTGMAASSTSFFHVGGPEPLTCLTGLLVLLSALLVPVSAEAVRMVIQGDSYHPGQGNANNCAITLGVVHIPASLAIALLSLMALIVIVIYMILRRYRTGVAAKPWSISALSKYASDHQMRLLLSHLAESRGSTGALRTRDVARICKRRRFMLANVDGADSDGNVIMVYQDAAASKQGDHTATSMEPTTRQASFKWLQRRRSGSMIPTMLTLSGRISILLLLLGVLILIVTYENIKVKSDFESFLDSETTGVRILFSGMGITITLLWTLYFQNVATTSPYHMAQNAVANNTEDDEKRKKISGLSPPTNPFSGLYRVLTGQYPDVYLGAVAFTAILSEFLPTFLVNVPYRVIETYQAHEACLWLAVAVLAAMICTILASFLVRWPHMAVDPGTLLGAMYCATEGREFPDLGRTAAFSTDSLLGIDTSKNEDSRTLQALSFRNVSAPAPTGCPETDRLFESRNDTGSAADNRTNVHLARDVV